MKPSDLKRGDIFYDASGDFEPPHWRHVCVRVDQDCVWYMDANWNWSAMLVKRLAGYVISFPQDSGEEQNVADVLAGEADNRFPWGPDPKPISVEDMRIIQASLDEYLKPELMAKELSGFSMLNELKKNKWRGGAIKVPFLRGKK